MLCLGFAPGHGRRQTPARPGARRPAPAPLRAAQRPDPAAHPPPALDLQEAGREKQDAVQRILGLTDAEADGLRRIVEEVRRRAPCPCVRSCLAPNRSRPSGCSAFLSASVRPLRPSTNPAATPPLATPSRRAAGRWRRRSSRRPPSSEARPQPDKLGQPLACSSAAAPGGQRRMQVVSSRGARPPPAARLAAPAPIAHTLEGGSAIAPPPTMPL